MTYEQQVKLWMKAVEKNGKRVLSSRKRSIEFLKKAGILTKSGKRLTKAYR